MGFKEDKVRGVLRVMIPAGSPTARRSPGRRTWLQVGHFWENQAELCTRVLFNPLNSMISNFSPRVYNRVLINL